MFKKMDKPTFPLSNMQLLPKPKHFDDVCTPMCLATFFYYRRMKISKELLENDIPVANKNFSVNKLFDVCQ